MRKSFFLTMALCVLGFGSSLLTGCDEYELYKIDSPEDLKDKVDSIAAANNPQRGDTLKLDIITAIVGAEDNSAAWWTAYSDYFTIPSNRLLHLEFLNYGTGVNNWNNWNLCLCEGERDGAGYAEYFVLRSDMYGWGNGDYNGAMIKSDYAEKLVGDDMWAVFREKMQGAMVYMDVDHSKTGNAYVTVKHVATDGTEFTQTYEQPVSSTADINAFLVCDGSHFVMKDAYTITSKVQAVDDVEAASISVVDYPTVLEVGNDDYWGTAKATVTFADGSSVEPSVEDLTFVVPDLTTPGKKTIVVSYSKTKQGNYGKSVATYYNIDVINPISALEVTKLPEVRTYKAHAGFMDALNVEGLEVDAIYADGSREAMDLNNLQIYLEPIVGEQEVIISYIGTSATVTTSYTVTVEEGSFKVGAEDFTNGWWTTFSNDVVVPAGQSRTMKMLVLSDNLGNWHSPCTILRKKDMSEYAVVRMDNYGWGAGYEGNPNLVLSCDWNWDTFMSSINNSIVEITVTNNGDNTADVFYDVEYENGDKHFQSYIGIAVDSNNLQMALVTEESCLISHE